MNLEQQKDYILKHGVILPNSQVFLTKPLYVFKKIRTYRPEYDIEVEMGPFGHYLQQDIQKVLKTVQIRNWYEAICNLIIPVGSLVNLPGLDKKMRSNQAVSYSIIRLIDRKPVVLGISGYSKDFIYLSARNLDPDGASLKRCGVESYSTILRESWVDEFMVRPRDAFDTGPGVCCSGIHFFLEAKDAIHY